MDAQNNIDPGNAFTLGAVIGKLETRYTASETAVAAMTERLTAIETRIDEGEKRSDVLHDAMLLLAANAGKRIAWKQDDATGEDVLSLVDAPAKTDAISKQVEGTSKGVSTDKSGKASASGDPETGENNSGQASVQPARTGLFDASRMVKPKPRMTFL